MTTFTDKPYALFIQDECIETNLSLNHLINRGLKYGDGIFETIGVKDGQIRFLDEHIERLLNGCQVLNLETKHKHDFALLIIELLNYAVQKCNEPVFRLRLNVIRNGGGFYQPIQNDIIFILEIHFPVTISKHPLKLHIWDEYLIVPSPLTAIKTINRLPNVWGYIERGKPDILLNIHRRIVESLNANLFFIRQDKKVLTPPLSEGAIAGIMRKKVLQTLKENAEECPVTIDSLKEYKACFATNVIQGIQPIYSINDIQYDTEHPIITDLITTYAGL
jgi:branched-chain amino acid aminotransferase